MFKKRRHFYIVKNLSNTPIIISANDQLANVYVFSNLSAQVVCKNCSSETMRVPDFDQN